LKHRDGRCENLTADNLCAIYSTRPEICRVEHCIDKLQMPKREAFALTARQCNVWMEEDGMPESFRLDVQALSGDAQAAQERAND